MRIILLADQDRLIRLFKGSGALSGVEIRVESAVEGALGAISARQPDLIFIQERLGEVSGEMIAHRLAIDLKGKKSRIVLIGDPGGSAVSTGKPPHMVLDAALSDPELAEAVMRTVSSPRPGSGKRRAARKKKGDDADAGPREDTAPEAPPLPTDTVSDVVELGGAGPSPAVTPPPRSRFQRQLENAMEGPPQGEGVSGALPLGPPAGSSGPGKVPTGAPFLEPSLLSRILARARGPKGAVIGMLLIVGAALLFALLSGQDGPGENNGAGDGKVADTSAKNQSSPAPPPSGRLPSFIPHLKPDKGYAATHPGWERYQDPATEFRVYREQGAVRAIQVIDRSGAGVPPGLFDSALREVSGSSRYQAESGDRKGDYLVEKGRLQNGLRIIVYLKGKERGIKAFVIEYP